VGQVCPWRSLTRSTSNEPSNLGFGHRARGRGVYHEHVPDRLPHKCGRKDRAAHGTYRTRDLILGYYDAYAGGEPGALKAWLGPEEKRTAERHTGGHGRGGIRRT
jgi:hypothetical protein